MAFSNGPKSIVQDGLVFLADPANTLSYTSGSVNAYNLQDMSITGSLVNSAQYSPVGGGSWATDGTDDYLNFGEQSFLEGKTNLTISCWHQSTIAANKVLWGASTTSVNAYLVVLIYYSSNRIYVEYNNGGGLSGYRLDTGDLTVDEWGEITVVFDASESTAADKVKMYINGKYLAFSATPSTFVSTAADLDPFYLGTDNKYSIYDWQGYIGPTMVYNRSLTAAEVLQNYNATKGRFS